MHEESEKLQRDLAHILPQQIRRAARAYQVFADADAPADAKEFAAFHSACKSALAHLELLLKLYRWSAPTLADEQSHGDLENLLANARKALSHAGGLEAAGVSDTEGSCDTLEDAL